MEIDGDKVVIGYTLERHADRHRKPGRHPHRHDPRPQEPRRSSRGGQRRWRANGVLPLGQTTTPYQIYDAFFDVTKAASGWDTETVKQSLNVLSETIDQTYPHLSAALDGVARFSDTIGKRDEDIKKLLANANKIAGVLGNRSEQINALLVERADPAGRGQRAQLRGQHAAGAGRRSSPTQVKGFIDDNPNLNQVLEQLRTISDVLKDAQVRPRRRADHR